MEIAINIQITSTNYMNYELVQYNIPNQQGVIVAQPYFNKDGEYVGYLIYHDKDNYGYTEDQLKKICMDLLSNYSPSGVAGTMIPLPYKPLPFSAVGDVMQRILSINATIDLNHSIYI